MILFGLLTLVVAVSAGRRQEPYYGVKIGPLQNFAHGINGTVFAVDDSTIFIKGFSYDGRGPDAFFWIGNSPRPSPDGYIIPYPEDYTGRGLKNETDKEVNDQKICGTLARESMNIKRDFRTCYTKTKKDNTWYKKALKLYNEINECHADHCVVGKVVKDMNSKLKSAYNCMQEHDLYMVYPILHPALFGGNITGHWEDARNAIACPDPPILGAYQNADIILRLPMGKRIKDIRWLSVWCRRFTVDFGEVFIPPNLDVPKPRVLPEFKRLAHGLRSDNISILDAKTLYIPNLHYDGAGPDAYFWVGNGTEPSSFGIKVPNEMGSLNPLRGYQGEDIEIQLPGSITVYDIDWLAVWCVQHKHNFGHVFIPKDLDVPPALGQTKISTSSTNKPPISTNCREFLDRRLQVTWILKGDMVEITLSAKIREDQYVAFGLSGAQNRPQMVGADVTVAFYDTETRNFRAVDYYLSQTAQCDGKVGVCPDERIGGRDDVTLLKGARNNGVLQVTYTRPLQTNEAVNDRAIPIGGPVSVIAAFGPLNSRKEANAHSVMDKTTEDYQIDFGDDQDHDCSGSLYDLVEDEGPKAWPQTKIIGENTITARIGPTGGKRGYTKITGLPSWGIAWWLNDLLIPELVVERGQTYSFVVEGGDDSTNSARYHPFYITDNSEGGYGQKGAREQSKQKVYAGVEFDREGYPSPTAAGRYCEWTHKSIDKSAESETFETYVKTLRLECDNGQPAHLNWTVPMDAPDQLYYQCYTHNNLGWRIKVVDPGYIEKQNGTSAATMMTHLNLLIVIIGVTSSIFWLTNDNVRIF